MRTEKVVAAGGGHQTLPPDDSSNRWGDYSSMAIDPVDSCTFWYTTEYLQVSASFNAWSTRLASFKFPNCK